MRTRINRSLSTRISMRCATRGSRTLAHCCEDSDGFPQEVSDVLKRTTEPLLANLSPLT